MERVAVTLVRNREPDPPRVEPGEKGSRREEGSITEKGRGDGPVSQCDPVEHRPDWAAGRAGHCPDPGLATP